MPKTEGGCTCLLEEGVRVGGREVGETWEQGGRQNQEAARRYPGGCGKRFLAREEHLSRAHTEGDKRVKTGVRLGGLV